MRDADLSWLTVAATAQAVSMTMFGWQQRRLLHAFGVTMSLHRSVALAYSRSAIAISSSESAPRAMSMSWTPSTVRA